MQFTRLRDVNLEPLWEEEINHKLALKHALLFSQIDGEKRCIVEEKSLVGALNHLSKLSLDYPVNIVDAESFERLKNKFLEKSRFYYFSKRSFINNLYTILALSKCDNIIC